MRVLDLPWDVNEIICSGRYDEIEYNSAYRRWREHDDLQGLAEAYVVGLPLIRIYWNNKCRGVGYSDADDIKSTVAYGFWLYLLRKDDAVSPVTKILNELQWAALRVKASKERLIFDANWYTDELTRGYRNYADVEDRVLMAQVRTRARALAVSSIRFFGDAFRCCLFVIDQMLLGNGIDLFYVRDTFGISNPAFYTDYCAFLLRAAVREQADIEGF